MLLDGKGLLALLRPQVKEVDCLTLQQRLIKNEPLLLIDIREEKETQAGYATGSLLVPRGILETKLTTLPEYQTLIKTVPSAAQIPLYLMCRSGVRSIFSAASLQQMGYQNVYSIAGGFLAWQAQGFDVTRG